MKTYKTYFNRIKKAVPALAAAALLMVNTSCERRDLWVYQDQFKQILMIIDWRNYDRDQQLYPHTPDPDGMTLWFFPTDGRKSYRYTTAEVNRYELYLSEGDDEGLVIDYSPAEYGHQEFVGMDYANTAEVKSIPSYYQPNKYPELYGPDAYGKTLPLKIDSTGFYAVAYEPEKIRTAIPKPADFDRFWDDGRNLSYLATIYSCILQNRDLKDAFMLHAASPF